MKKFLFLSISLIILSGCFKAAPPITKLSDANKKFAELTLKETGIKPLLKEADNTLWIYIPTKEHIIQIKASGQKPVSTNEASDMLSIKYVDAYYKDKTFHIEYDISKDKKYNQNYGYTSTYTEKYQTWQRSIIYNLQNAYGDIEKVPGDVTYKDPVKEEAHKRMVKAHVKTAKAPDFYIFVVADIVNGIEAKTTIYHDDISKILSPVIQLPMEEATTRYLVKIQGDNAIVKDTEGKHLNYAPMTLPDFLAKQIVNRINFKYTRSSFPPTEDAPKEILTAVAKSLHYYHFTDYQEVVLHNLAIDSEQSFSPSDIEAYQKESKEEKPPKYHVIKFNGGEQQ